MEGGHWPSLERKLQQDQTELGRWIFFGHKSLEPVQKEAGYVKERPARVSNTLFKILNLTLLQPRHQIFIKPYIELCHMSLNVAR